MSNDTITIPRSLAKDILYQLTLSKVSTDIDHAPILRAYLDAHFAASCGDVLIGDTLLRSVTATNTVSEETALDKEFIMYDGNGAPLKNGVIRFSNKHITLNDKGGCFFFPHQNQSIRVEDSEGNLIMSWDGQSYD